MRYAALLIAFLLPATAFAFAAADLPYDVHETFSAAVRFVRIDRGCKVTDRDPDTAFVTFECKDNDQLKRGSVEMFATPKDGRAGARVKVTLGDDPHYEELRFLELLERKMRSELGTPPPAPAPPAAPAKKSSPDGGI